MMSYLKKANSFDDWFTQKENLAQGHRLLNCGWRFVERNSGGGIQVAACLPLSPSMRRPASVKLFSFLALFFLFPWPFRFFLEKFRSAML